MLESGEATSETDIARKIGTSRVLVCQYVSILRLDASIIRALEQLGDPLTKRVITERGLRPYLTKSPKEQQKLLQLLANGV